MSDIPPGTWRPVCFGSGTVIVDNGKHGSAPFGGQSGVGPHVRIMYRANGGDAKRDDTDVTMERYHVAQIIAGLLNGDKIPRDGLGLIRTGEITGIHEPTGKEFIITGPFIDSRPPTCLWVQDDSDAAANARARLMDAVFGINR